MTTLNGNSHSYNHPAKVSISNDMILIVMGPSACGKSEVGSGLANHFQCPYIDGDSFHSKENIHKMKNGISLTDEDRIPWLMALAQEIRKYSNPSSTDLLSDANHAPPCVSVVLACSALKKFYRDILRTGNPTGGNDNGGLTNGSSRSDSDSHSAPDSRTPAKVIFVFLDCSKSTLEERIMARKNHFMKVNLLDSQLATLENPVLDGNNEFTATVRVNGDLELDEILKYTANELKYL